MLIKDWRDPALYRPALYRFSKRTARHWWAWEFLRRNPDYQREWEEELGGCRFFDRPTPPDELPPSNDFHFIITETGSPDDPWFHIRADKGNRWGLTSYVNPRTDRPKALGFNLPPTIFQRGPRVPDPRKLGKYVGYVPFDLARPLEPQLDTARHTLKTLQGDWEKGHLRVAKPARERSEKWPSYLRLLDAEAAGATTPADIMAVLEIEDPPEDWKTDEQTIKARLTAARRLTRPEGYLALIRYKK